MQLGESHCGESLLDGLCPDAVQCGVDDDEVARSVRVHDADRPGEVGLEDVVAEDLPALVRAGHGGHRLDASDVARDLGIGGGDDLGAVAEVDLVSVVLRRVVAGRDHDAGVRTQVPDRIREDRGG